MIGKKKLWFRPLKISDGLLRTLKARADFFENLICSTTILYELERILYTAPPPVYTDNLVASYSFDTNFTDYTGNNNLSANGNVVAGVNGGVVDDCASFDGDADYALAVDSDDFSFTDGVTDLPFSISFWANFDTISNTDPTYIMSKRAGGGDREWQIYFNIDGTVLIALGSDGNFADYLLAKFIYTPTIGGTTWSHYTFVYSGSETFSGIKMYLNGVSQTLTNSSAGTYLGMNNTTATVNVGTWGPSPTNYEFDGKIDELHVWKNRELTQAEVLDIYTTELGGTSILPI
tara:strand:- start:61 stop:930 length:870 start_codon:yes stop_codon:yes gene_type:complete